MAADRAEAEAARSGLGPTGLGDRAEVRVAVRGSGALVLLVAGGGERQPEPELVRQPDCEAHVLLRVLQWELRLVRLAARSFAERDHRSDAAQIPTGWAVVAVTRLSIAGPFMPIIGDAIAPSPRIS